MIFLEPVLVALIVAVAFPPFHGLWPLAFVAFVFFARLLLAQESGRGAARQLAIYTFAVNIFGFYWLAYTLKEFGGLSWWGSVPLMMIIYLCYSVVPALFGYLWIWLKRRVPARVQPWTLVAVLVLWDGLDPRLFPWSPVMSVGADPWLMASAYRLGTWGWRVLFFGVAVFIAQVSLKDRAHVRRAAVKIIAGLAAALALAYAIGIESMRTLKRQYAERQPVAIIQGNIGNYEKKLTKLRIMPTVQNVLRIHRDLVEQIAIHEAPVADQNIEPWVAWPETSYPGYVTDGGVDQRILEDWAKLTRGLHLVGSYANRLAEFGGQPTRLEYNILALFHERDGLAGEYLKFLRVPFGEYIPGDEFYPRAYRWLPAVNHFGQGTVKTGVPHPDPKGVVFVPLVCYEILFESFVNDFVAQAHKKFPGRSLVLVNPTNDSWYGPTSEPYQNMFLARWAAARQGLSLIRATNTGISVIVAPWGEIIAQSPRDETLVIYGDLPVEHTQRRLITDPSPKAPEASKK